MPTTSLVSFEPQCTSINDKSIGRNYPFDEIEYVDISSVTEGYLTNTAKHPLTEAPSRARRLVDHGDTIWSTVRPNRRSYLLINQPSENLVVSTGFAVLSPKHIPPAYLYIWTTTNDFVEYLTYRADGSAYPAVLPERFAEADILLAANEVFQAFDALVAPMQDRIAENDRVSRTLAATRDALLPKLLSGDKKIRSEDEQN